jgi:hypothetical protein
MMNSPAPPPTKNKNVVLWVVVGVLAICACGVVPILAAILLPVFSQAKFAAQRTAALSNSKRAALGAILYSADYDNRLPLAQNWMDSTFPYSKSETVFRSPLAMKDNPDAYGFAFRLDLSGKKMADIAQPAKAEMIFDSTDTSRNAHGNLELLPRPGRYGTGARRSNIIAYADGHAKAVQD